MNRPIHAELTGTVWKVLVKVGQAIDVDDTLLIMESMKREIPILADTEGTVSKIPVNEGDPVEEGDLLLELA
ncbi:biotin/lipoyl-binding carrier protein [Rhodococcus sp. USK10]|uniref:biotin carboxylase n=1 Tax=Rhodococcus wratislaviensis TaxID=44752 RepID=A0A402CJ03_RHOWR|nr:MULTISPECIES: biotin/lipoyl-binding carrier protein [Rhodococcus]QYB04553.1 biotin/lipoyl-binding carrier protein [Rhodococcus sp. USK10]GCE43557.1 Biotin carboxyl carrier protein [Rhodococcus wratislaviensis]